MIRLVLAGLLAGLVTIPIDARAADADAPTVQLYVYRNGTGGGDVVSDPPGISCGPDCEEYYEQGTVVTLTPSPATYSVFSGWSGCDSVEGTQCRVTMVQARTVDARFARDSGTTDGPALVLQRPRAGIYANDLQLAPGGPATVVVGHVLVEVQAADVKSGVAGVRFEVNGSPVDPSQVTSQGESYRFMFRPTAVREYIITARATNGEGRVSSLSLHVQGIPAG